MNNTKKNLEWEEWLESSGCLDLLQSLAQDVVYKARIKGLQPELLGIESFDDTKGYGAIVSNLWIFLKESLGTPDKFSASLIQLLEEEEFTKAGNLIILGLLKSCVEQRRIIGESPFHAYYKRIRQVIYDEWKDHDHIYYESTTDKSFYAYSQDDSLEHIPGDILSEIDYSSWRHPGEDKTEIHKKKSMLKIAQIFWEDSVLHFEGNFILPIRELVIYINTFYGLYEKKFANLITSPQIYVGGELESLSVDEMHAVTTPETSHFAAWDHEKQQPINVLVGKELQQLADDFHKTLTVAQKELLYLRFEMDLTFKEIKEQTGINTPAYQIEKLRDSLKKYWSLWSKPVYDEDEEIQEDVAQEEFRQFYERIIYLCKIEFESRNT